MQCVVPGGGKTGEVIGIHPGPFRALVCRAERFEDVQGSVIIGTFLSGDGLYGVDLKQIGEEVKVIEVNDNPNLDAGVEDAVDDGTLYRTLARFFRERIESARG